MEGDIHMNSNWHAQMMVDEINKQSERDALLKETHDTLLKMQEDSKKESRQYIAKRSTHTQIANK